MAKRRKTAVKRSGSKRPVQGAVSTRLSTEWYWEQDAELRFTHVQVPAGAPLEQRLGELILGKRRWETGVGIEGGWEAHRRLLDARKPFNDVLMWRDFEDGSRRYIITSGEPVYDEAGRFRGYRGVARDITDQRRGEQLLRLEHQITSEFAAGGEVSDALKSALRAICETENWQLGRYVKVDEARDVLVFGEAWGIPEATIERYLEDSRTMVYPRGHGLVGKVWQSGEPLWVPDVTDDPRVARPGLARETGLRSSLVVPVASEGRTSGIFIFHSYRSRQPDERLLQAVTVIGRQIAQLLKRAEAEAALRRSEDRFRSLSNLSSDWFWETDVEHRFVSSAARTREVTGFAAQIYVGKRRWEVPGLSPVSGDWTEHRQVLARRESFRDLELAQVRADGSRCYLQISGEPVYDPDGSFAGYRGTAKDITAQKRNEQLLRLEHQVALALSDAGDTVSGVKAVMRAVCEAEGWACGRYFRVDEAANELRFEYGWAMGRVAQTFVERSQGLRFKPGQGLAGIVWQSGEPLWSTDTSRDSRVMAKTLTDGTGIRGAFVFPVVSGGKPIAVLSFTSQEVRKPDERLLRAASVIAAQIGQFLQRKSAEESLRESEVRFRSLTQMSSDFFWESDTAHRITDVAHGPNYAGKLGKEKLLGNTAWDFPSTTPDEAGWARVRETMDAHLPLREFEFGRPLSNGGTRYFSVSGDPYFAADGRFVGYRGVGRDITDAVLARERIASLAYSDALTGLANRTSLGPTLEQAVERTRRRGSKLAGVFIDLDGFKEVNDLHGHDAGDRLLIELARRLRSQLRAGDPLARLGGDEFFVVLEDMQQTGPADNVARKLLSAILEPFDVGASMPVRISASIGISVFPDDAGDGATLVKHSDMAMYAAKQAGKNAYRFFKDGPAANDPKTQASEKNA